MPWPPHPPRPLQSVALPAALTREGVALWQVDLGQGDEHAAAAGLGPHELRRWRAFRCPRARTRYARLQARLRELLHAAFGLDLQGRSWTYGAHGKPVLPGGQGPFFSLSHSGDCGCIALSARRELGVDVECLAAWPTADALPGVFTPRERAHLAGAGAAGMWRLWTRKEAVLKALGCGFAADPSALCVAPVPGADGAAEGERCAGTRLWSIDAIAGCAAAIACVETAGAAPRGC